MTDTAAIGNVEHAFITSVVEAADVEGISLIEDDAVLLDAVSRAAWTVVTDHVRRFGRVPGMDFLLRKVPSFPVRSWGAAPGALAEMVQQQWLKSRFFNVIEDVSADDEADPREQVAKMIAELGKLTAGTKTDRHSQRDLLRGSRDRYHQRRDGEAEPRLVFPWAPMQSATGGAGNGTLTLFYGRTKNMKSWLMLYVALGWWKAGRRILTVVKEMSPEEWSDRLLVQLAGVSASRFRDSCMTELEELAIDDAMELSDRYDSVAPAGVVHLGGTGREAALRIEAEGVRMGLREGDVVVVDGGYLFSDRDWQLLAQFTSELKQVLIRQRWVGLMTMQANREADDKGEVRDVGREMGGGDAPAQDADLLIRVTLLEDRIRVKVPGGRNNEPCDFAVHAKPGVDFSLAAFDPAPVKRRTVGRGAPSAARRSA